MKSLFAVIAMAVAVVATGIYWVASEREVATEVPHSNSSGTAPVQSSSSMNLDSVDNMVGGLEARLRDNPDDGKGWLLLAKSYRHMGRMDEARDAYRKAESLGVSEPVFAAKLLGQPEPETAQ